MRPATGNRLYNAEAAPYDPSGVVGQCDGVARSLVDRQGINAGYPPTAAVPTNGWWYGHSYASNHFPFETSWSIIMLRRTVFVSCVNNLNGRGTPSGRAPARIDLTWTGIPSAVLTSVLRDRVWRALRTCREYHRNCFLRHEWPGERPDLFLRAPTSQFRSQRHDQSASQMRRRLRSRRRAAKLVTSLNRLTRTSSPSVTLYGRYPGGPLLVSS